MTVQTTLTPLDLIKIVNTTFTKKTFFLLAISGGLDSMVLLELFRLSGLQFEVAHVNYGLRGNSSDEDLKLIDEVCNAHQITLYVKTVNPIEFEKSEISKQMLARRIRYNFFRDLLSDSESLEIIVTAHHQDDQIETFFINLLRSSGLRGLSGMKVLENSIFRPFLNFSKSQLLDFAKKSNICWREDQTNYQDIYLRNKIRNQLIPVLEFIQPNYKKSIIKSMFFIDDAERILTEQFKKIKTQILKMVDSQSEKYFFLLKRVKQLPLTFLYFLFSKFGGISLNEIQKFIQSSVGTSFSNNQFTFWIDYKYLIIEANQLINFNEFIFSTCNFSLKNPLNIKGKCLKHLDSSAQCCLDAEKIQFPLKIRKWNLKDRIMINTNTLKKVSKYLKDEKISRYFKNQTYVLVDDLNRILWVIGKKGDCRFKISKKTKKFLNIWINSTLITL